MLALGLALLHFILSLFLLPAYGPTWDAVIGDYAYGERILDYLISGELHLQPEHTPTLSRGEPHPDFRLEFSWFQLYPLASTLSALSCQVFFTQLGLCSALTAHHLVIVGFVSLLVGVLFAFAAPRLGIGCTLASLAFLIFSPRFFAHSFNNLKDIPEACLYSFAVLAGYLALTKGTLRLWLLTGALTGLALAQKANALFIPVQLALFTGALFALRQQERPKLFPGLPLALLGFAISYLIASPPLWTDTVNRLSLHFQEIFRSGNVMAGGQDLPAAAPTSFDGVYNFFLTTPSTMLVLGLIGALSQRVPARLRAFLIIWILVPVGRTALPGMRNFDGVRHFLEFYPGLALLAAIGLATAADYLRERSPKNVPSFLAPTMLATLVLGLVLLATITTHPNGICYYSGSLARQQAAGNPEATDYWGNSYWQGLEWLNENAEPDATLVVPVAPAIVRSAVPVKLRADITLWETQAHTPTAPLYVMYITRELWYGPLVSHARTIPPVHVIRIQGGEILRIHRIPYNERESTSETWRRENRAQEATLVIQTWAVEDPTNRVEPVSNLLAAVTLDNLDQLSERLDAMLPEHLREAGRDVLWLYASRKRGSR